MVQSVELLPSPTVEAWVRDQWRALVEAGLSSLANHQGETNRPHVTLAVAQSVDADAEARLDDALALWPQAVVRLGGLVVFGPQGRDGRCVLARLVVPSQSLLALQERVAAAWRHAEGVPWTTRTGAWTPHVTLAMRLTPEQVGQAVAVVGRWRPLDEPGPPTGVRRWDGDARREWWLARSPG
ncbi:2'-5' RNA ligase family protein [Aquipuribacter nitratireducens]|uniref:2'-5' RNA ligase family protein n=1 Tax=Aquipuribacter nitratireducens TaxID=650104 RepID=A0ABW0GPP8_9MICO